MIRRPIVVLVIWFWHDWLCSIVHEGPNGMESVTPVEYKINSVLGFRDGVTPAFIAKFHGSRPGISRRLQRIGMDFSKTISEFMTHQNFGCWPLKGPIAVKMMGSGSPILSKMKKILIFQRKNKNYLTSQFE